MQKTVVEESDGSSEHGKQISLSFSSLGCHSVEAPTITASIRVRGKEVDRVRKRKGIKRRGKVRLP